MKKEDLINQRTLSFSFNEHKLEWLYDEILNK